MASSSGGKFRASVYLLILVQIQTTLLQEIRQAPEDTTTFLDESATFMCEVVGDISGWKVNGTLLQDLPPENFNDLRLAAMNTPQGSTIETLTIPARAEYSGSRFQCVVLNIGSPSVSSENAILKIQGLLPAVGGLEVTNDTNSVTISWTAPFSLDVTGVDPDIWYSVLIYNVTDENNPTAIPCTDCTNITETHYTFSPDYFTPCHMYKFSVIPVNGAGEGERSEYVTGYIPNFSDEPIRPSISALSSNVCRVAMTGDRVGGCSFNFAPAKMDESVIRQSPSLQNSFDLFANREYSFRMLLNAVGGNLTFLVNFTTYDIQNATATTLRIRNGIYMTGQFIENTKARGCFVVLQCEDGSPDQFIILPRSESKIAVASSIGNVRPSTYTTFVHDLEQNGLPHETPSIPNNTVTVTLEQGSLPKTSYILTNASIILTSGSVITVECEFREQSKNSSCVLIYRKYGNETLVVKEYPQNTVFPVTLTAPGEPNTWYNYTIAVFGKNNSLIDERPLVAIRVPPSPTSLVNGGSVNVDVLYGVLAVNVILIIILLTTVIVLLSISRKCIGKSSLEDKRKMINIRIETIDVDIEMSDHTSAPDCIRGDGCGFSPVAEMESSRSHDDVPEVAVSKIRVPTNSSNDNSSQNRGSRTVMPYEGDAESVIVMFSALKEDRPVISDSDEEAEFTGREICRPYEAEETNQAVRRMFVCGTNTYISSQEGKQWTSKQILLSDAVSAVVCGAATDVNDACVFEDDWAEEDSGFEETDSEKEETWKETGESSGEETEDLSGEETETTEERELDLTSDHPNMVCFTGESPLLPSPLPVPENITVVEVIQAVQRGLEFLHSHPPTIIHQDLAAENVLGGYLPSPKVSDSSLCLQIDSDYKTSLATKGIDVEHVCIFTVSAYQEESDIFTCGVLNVTITIQTKDTSLSGKLMEMLGKNWVYVLALYNWVTANRLNWLFSLLLNHLKPP